MLVGRLIRKRRYSRRKVSAVILVSLGVLCCTTASAAVRPTRGDGTAWRYPLGVGLLTMGLLGGAMMGLLQEDISRRFGKYPREMLLYTVMSFTNSIF